MIDISHCYLGARDLDASGGPALGAGWSVLPLSGGWYLATRLSDGLIIAAWKANGLASRGLFALYGPQALLDAIASGNNEVMAAREAWDRRAETAVKTWLRRWRTWRCSGLRRTGGGYLGGADDYDTLTSDVAEIIPEGAQIPDPTLDPFPWLLGPDGSAVGTQAEAAYSVTSIDRPAMGRTLAGWPGTESVTSLSTILEDEGS